ncbi:DUF3784 domain-containing protein [Anaerosporobacter sp.]
MNIGFYACLILAIIFGILTFVFFLLKEKGAMLISGFNTLPKHERELYDIAKLSKDQRNSMFIWLLIMCVGALFSFFISQYFAIIAFVVWLIMYFKDVHIDTVKSFEKYKIK